MPKESNTKIAIINGANLNLLGEREVQIYGRKNFDDYLAHLQEKHSHTEIHYFQSNVEGEIINQLQQYSKEGYKGIILNPGGYSHTSVAIADAIAAITTPVIEVHISNVHAREEYRHTLLTGAKCAGVITGLGFEGYRLAIHYLLHYIK